MTSLSGEGLGIQLFERPASLGRGWSSNFLEDQPFWGGVGHPTLWMTILSWEGLVIQILDDQALWGGVGHPAFWMTGLSGKGLGIQLFG